MKAKYLLLVLDIFCCMSIKAIEKDILLYNSCSDDKGKWCKDKRSITLVPTATIDGNTIRIYSDVIISGLQTSIKDSMGNIVYSYNDMTPSRCHTFEVYGLPEGEYLLEKVNHIDTYQKTLDVLHLIDAHIPNHWLAVRINFDNRTLAKIDEIIANLAFLDRKKCFVILKKVWQIETQKVNTPLLHTAIQKFFDNNFLLDYYIMPKGCVCFAQRLRQALFNYDGKIFKCTTISSFGDENALGNLNMETGEIEWDTNKISQWMKDAQPEQCRLCKWYPACLGICNRQLIAHPNENMCTFDAMNLTQKEYLMYSFKFHLLKKQLGHIK